MLMRIILPFLTVRYKREDDYTVSVWGWETCTSVFVSNPSLPPLNKITV